MDEFRLNPVALITGATSEAGAACVHALAPRATGGLILIDADETRLGEVADSLAAAPERVSTLAFDVADADHWAKAHDFIADQYGRLDWAIVNAHDAAERVSKGPLLSFRVAMALMRANAQGGAIVALAAASALNVRPRFAVDDDGDGDLARLIRTAVEEGRRDRIRVNVIATCAKGDPAWPEAAIFQDLVNLLGDEASAFAELARLEAPVARCLDGEDGALLAAMLLTDAAPLTGGMLVVDGGPTN